MKKIVFFILIILSITLLFGCTDTNPNGNGNNTDNNDNNLPDNNADVNNNDFSSFPITTYKDNGNNVCTVDGKPVIRLFSTTWCSHCKWIKPTFDSVVKEYVDAGKIIAYHWELDTKDDTLTEAIETEIPATELAIFSQFNPKSSIPTFVLGCKYSRIGNGYEASQDLVSEELELRAVIETLIGEAQ
jgi:thiol-disulfide isomerase/thioredoxin